MNEINKKCYVKLIRCDYLMDAKRETTQLPLVFLKDLKELFNIEELNKQTSSASVIEKIISEKGSRQLKLNKTSEKKQCSSDSMITILKYDRLVDDDESNCVYYNEYL
jgi:hypothetical protein